MTSHNDLNIEPADLETVLGVSQLQSSSYKCYMYYK